MFPRKWSEEFIDAPMVKHQRQPSTDREGMEAILKEANEQYRALYALLAGCGPMRAGEALGLEIDKHISEDYRTLYIRQKAKRGILQPYTKTRSGTEVNLDGERPTSHRSTGGTSGDARRRPPVDTRRNYANRDST